MRMVPGARRVSCSIFTVCVSNASRPRNQCGLFNLCHSALRNIIEHIFGVLKHQWPILEQPPEYNMDIQARIPAALCALHNFINHFDTDAFNDPDIDWDYMRFDEGDDLPADDMDEELVQQEGDQTRRAAQ